MKSFRATLRILLGATIGLVVIGVIVRATDSGMGCPDWPLCYGQLIPPTTDSGDVIAYKAWLEWIHRAIAAVIGLIVLALVFIALRNLKVRRSLQGASIALLALVLGDDCGLDLAGAPDCVPERSGIAREQRRGVGLEPRKKRAI